LHNSDKLEGAASLNEHLSSKILIRSLQLIDEFLIETYGGYPEAAQDVVLITTTEWTQYENNEAQIGPEEAKAQ
jgi:hypothetical protein